MAKLFIDCRFGLGGDMFLAALADMGLNLQPLVKALGQAGISIALDAPEVRVHGLAGRRLSIDAPGVQPLRHLPEIMSIVERLPLSEVVRGRVATAFVRLAEVEAKMHGIGVDEVHFHEVGAVDTLIDVAGAFYGLEALGVTRVLCSTLPWFGGKVECAHGTLPLPAPATLELMKGKPVSPTEFELEILTPTGALIIDQVVDEFVHGPEGVVRQVGRSFGTHDLGQGCGGLRLVLLDEH
ncbi:LarC family nickel insertion protein [Desulfovibrio ferrophilus]|uniref:UPF0272 protein Dbac_0709 n=1 Tax=Desulfovibrio ferrophilus TaxID=241368 RepID=A0A2Z6B032_9BACT|nr:LarC family nickel insertion protein [Desulfovibrio ferrophilus]BBD08810.1 UPF0272 protein Dbac_0709 [Desulfovibrio ferrophilus]